MSGRSAARARMQRAAHLVARFVESLRARPLDDATAAGAARALEPGELRVWAEMGRADRAEAVMVARRLEIALAGTPHADDTRWHAAALLHDAGKRVAGYGTAGRVLVTAAAAVLGETRLRGWAAQPAHGSGRATVRARMGSYVAHDELGAELLARAGARPEVVAWAGAHHRPGRWGATGIPPIVCRALAIADGEAVPG